MNKIKHFVQQSWLLIIASFCFGLLLAITNAALSPRIIQNEKEKLYSLMRQLVNDAKDFKKVIEKVAVANQKGKITETDIYQAIDSKGESLGFAFIASGAGFADKIKLVIVVDNKCQKFFGFKVLASNETPGFGNKITEDYFGSQFRNAPVEKLQLAKTGDAGLMDSQIVAISGATVSSNAVVKIFNNYIEEIKLQLHKKELINNGN
ncbi:MAG: FMN-binding protein [Planctomycetota bacterium]|jgi:electron transport complex protein RnfG